MSRFVLLRTWSWIMLPLVMAMGCSPRTGPGHGSPDGGELDLLLMGATLIDGTGAPQRFSDIGISEGRIVLVGDGTDRDAARTFDVSGLVVAPGFIDVHNHTEVAIAQDEKFKLDEQFVRQGVTTIVGGPDGSLSPDHLKLIQGALEARGTGVNVACYIGHNAIRGQVMGDSREPPTPEQMAEMKSLVREGMELGAVGFSTGLMYEPGMWSTTEEVAELAAEVAPFGGVYDSHVRSPVHEFVESHAEAIEIGRRARVPVKLGHLKSVGLENEGKMAEVIARVEAAREEGRVVVSDQYPYDGAATSTLAPGEDVTGGILLAPPDLLGNGELADFDFRSALKDPALRERIREVSENGIEGGFAWLKATGYSAMRITHSEDYPELVGRYLSEIAQSRGVEPFDAVAELVIAAEHPVHLTLGAIKEWEVRELMVQRWNMIASDGSHVVPGARGGHPRGTGTFPRLLGHYARDEELLTLEEAVRKVTSLPAEFLGLDDRGRIAEGLVADLVVFDPDEVIDRSTWTEPNLYAEGVIHVIVNGQLVLESGELTGAAPGRFVAPHR